MLHRRWTSIGNLWLGIALSLTVGCDPEDPVGSPGGGGATGAGGAEGGRGGAGGAGASTSTTAGGGDGGAGGQPVTCFDERLSDGETDIDCGGPSCARCAVGYDCAGPSDCETDACVDTFFMGSVCFPVHVFSAVYGDAEDQEVTKAALKTDGSLVVAGYFAGTLDFGVTELVSAGDTDTFILALGPTGIHEWGRAFGGTAFQQPVALTGEGDVTIIGGSTGGPIDFGNGPLMPAGSNDLFFAQLDGQGDTAWSRLAGGASLEMLGGISRSTNGDLLVAGTFLDTTDLGAGSLVSAGVYEVFLADLDPQGTTVRSSRFGGTADDLAVGIAQDGAGDIIVVGKSYGSIDFGDGTLEAPGFTAFLFAAKLDAATHEPLWTRTVPLAAAGTTILVAVDAFDDVVISGGFVDEIDLGTGTLTGDGFTSYVAKLDGATGTTTWAHGFLGQGRILDIALRDTDVFLLGQGEGPPGFAQPGTVGAFLARFDETGEFVDGFPLAGAPNDVDVVGSRIVVAGGLLGLADYGGAVLVSNDGSEHDAFLAVLELP